MHLVTKSSTIFSSNLKGYWYFLGLTKSTFFFSSKTSLSSNTKTSRVWSLFLFTLLPLITSFISSFNTVTFIHSTNSLSIICIAFCICLHLSLILSTPALVCHLISIFPRYILLLLLFKVCCIFLTRTLVASVYHFQ